MEMTAHSNPTASGLVQVMGPPPKRTVPSEHPFDCWTTPPTHASPAVRVHELLVHIAYPYWSAREKSCGSMFLAMEEELQEEYPFYYDGARYRTIERRLVRGSQVSQ